MTDKGAIANEIEELSKFIEEHTGVVREPQKRGEISVKEFMEQTGASCDQARKKLNEMVTMGLMDKRMAQNGRLAPMVVYWKK
jgi:Fic family protein